MQPGIGSSNPPIPVEIKEVWKTDSLNYFSEDCNKLCSYRNRYKWKKKHLHWFAKLKIVRRVKEYNSTKEYTVQSIEGNILLLQPIN